MFGFGGGSGNGQQKQGNSGPKPGATNQGFGGGSQQGNRGPQAHNAGPKPDNAGAGAKGGFGGGGFAFGGNAPKEETSKNELIEISIACIGISTDPRYLRTFFDGTPKPKTEPIKVPHDATVYALARAAERHFKVPQGKRVNCWFYPNSGSPPGEAREYQGSDKLTDETGELGGGRISSMLLFCHVAYVSPSEYYGFGGGGGQPSKKTESSGKIIHALQYTDGKIRFGGVFGSHPEFASHFKLSEQPEGHQKLVYRKTDGELELVDYKIHGAGLLIVCPAGTEIESLRTALNPLDHDSLELAVRIKQIPKRLLDSEKATSVVQAIATTTQHISSLQYDIHSMLAFGPEGTIAEDREDLKIAAAHRDQLIQDILGIKAQVVDTLDQAVDKVHHSLHAEKLKTAENKEEGEAGVKSRSSEILELMQKKNCVGIIEYKTMLAAETELEEKIRKFTITRNFRSKEDTKKYDDLAKELGEAQDASEKCAEELAATMKELTPFFPEMELGKKLLE